MATNNISLNDCCTGLSLSTLNVFFERLKNRMALCVTTNGFQQNELYSLEKIFSLKIN